jgi:hypothetical protein
VVSKKGFYHGIARVVGALLATSAADLAHAADQHGSYFIGAGIGGVTCPEFVNTMDDARRYAVGSLERVTRTNSYDMYVLGFQTGYNLAKPNTLTYSPASPPSRRYPSSGTVASEPSRPCSRVGAQQ